MRQRLSVFFGLICFFFGSCQGFTKAVTPEVAVNDARTISAKIASAAAPKTRSLEEFFICAANFDTTCLVESSETLLSRAANRLLAEADAAALKETGRSDEEHTPSALTRTITKLLSEFAKAFQSSVSGFFRTGKEDSSDEDEEDDEQELQRANDKDENNSIKTRSNGEARKKKKKHKVIHLIKLIALGAIIKAKLALLLKILSFKLQIKFFLVALAGLLLNGVKFYLDLKKGPQKVIYYEHAQHQHHYDHGEEGWGAPSGNAGYWGRSYDEEDEKSKAQDLAYSKQKPYKYSLVSDKPNYSWLG